FRFLYTYCPFRCCVRHYIRIFLLLICLSLLISYKFYGSSIKINIRSRMTTSNSVTVSSAGFLVNTKYCHIPDIDPFEQSVKDYFSVSHWKPCAESHSLTYQQDSILHLNYSVINKTYHKNFSFCKVFPIHRLDKDDASFEYLSPSIHFNNDIKITDEFIKVQCYDPKNKVIYTNFHAFIPNKNLNLNLKPKENNITAKIEKILMNIKNKSKKDILSNAKKKPTTPKNTIPFVKTPINILLIGMDSMSRLNFLRQMKMTHEYILKMDAIEMLGYNKVADNTFVNLVPLLTGKYLEDLPWNETLSGKPLDKYDFAWKRYKNYGFTTLFAEDYPSIATFNYLKFGFKHQPTDHYYRPFGLALEKESSIWSDRCIRDRTETGMLLQYTYDFAKVYNNTKHFGLTFIGRLTHDDINYAGLSDVEYCEFFKKLNNQKLLQNTLTVFFSDHGLRFGSFRKTYVGRLEERLPFMFIIPPPFFKTRYPEILNNMKINSRRLTTPFDVHATLIDALDIDKANFTYVSSKDYFPPNMKSISLFSKVPEERSCKSATILPHWCVCHQSTPLNISEQRTLLIANQLVNIINHLVSDFGKLCSKVRLSKILEASVIKASNDMMRFEYSHNDVINREVAYGDLVEQDYIDYQLNIVTEPGYGIFDATLRCQLKTKLESCSVIGEISRTSKYGSNGNCMPNQRLQRFCYCHKAV
ncbi:uncharacterized protein LOC115223036 isoform X2, partial [Argonauta hians]